MLTREEFHEIIAVLEQRKCELSNMLEETDVQVFKDDLNEEIELIERTCAKLIPIWNKTYFKEV